MERSKFFRLLSLVMLALAFILFVNETAGISWWVLLILSAIYNLHSDILKSKEDKDA